MRHNLRQRLRVLQHRASNAVNKRLFPKDVVQTIITLDEAPNVSNLQQWYPQRSIIIDDPDITQYLLPNRKRGNVRLVRPPLITCRLEGWHWHARHGILATPTFDVLLESAPIPRRLQQAGITQLPTRDVQVREGVYTSFWGLVTGNYYHFIESLFRLHTLYLVWGDEPLTVLMPSLTPPFGRMYLHYCLPASWHVEYVKTLSWVHAETFIFASYATNASLTLPPRDAIEAIRQRMFAAANITPAAQPHRRIYIMRNGVQQRRVLNQSAVLNTLVEFDFEVVTLEDLSLIEQVKLFHEAQIVVGAHGAGFANIIYSDALTMLEFMPQRIFKLYYYTLSHTIEHDWHYLRSTVDAPDDAIVVDIDQLRQKLAHIMVG